MELLTTRRRSPRIIELEKKKARQRNMIHLPSEVKKAIRVPNVKNKSKKLTKVILPQKKINKEEKVPSCNCPGSVFAQKSPTYFQLGCGSSLVKLRDDLEKRFELKGNAIRFEKICYTQFEGKSEYGCPIAKWIIRRSEPDEKILVLVKHRFAHTCKTAWMVVAIVAWDGILDVAADALYKTLTHKLNNFGHPTVRRCGLNTAKTCSCQGRNDKSGQSFSFGCSWSSFTKGCKFGKCTHPRKFKLTDKSEESELEEDIQELATNLATIYKKLVPEAFSNQVKMEKKGLDCRLGTQAGRPWSGVTVCMDYCTHSHKDLNNMFDGCTTVLTLTRQRKNVKSEKEQFHVLPLYTLDATDEFGSADGQQQKIADGCVEVLTAFPMKAGIRNCCSEGRCDVYLDNREILVDKRMGGVAIALSHGSVLFEYAKKELHATTALKTPNRTKPTRISLVFYQHQKLNRLHHGYYDVKDKLEKKLSKDKNQL